MPRDPRAEEVAAWLGRARQDLRAAEVLLGAEPPLAGDAAFHSQQAVEKALKALLTHHERPFGKTHDLGVLGMACLADEPTLEDLLRRSAPLTEHAWWFRYPGDVFEPGAGEVRDAVGLAVAVVAAVEGATRR
jgi:HEPN domain-containing protein